MLLGRVQFYKHHPFMKTDSSDIQELLQREDVREQLKKKKTCAIGYSILFFYIAHIGYFVPLTKIADFLRAGVHVSFFFFFQMYHHKRSNRFKTRLQFYLQVNWACRYSADLAHNNFLFYFNFF